MRCGDVGGTAEIVSVIDAFVEAFVFQFQNEEERQRTESTRLPAARESRLMENRIDRKLKDCAMGKGKNAELPPKPDHRLVF